MGLCDRWTVGRELSATSAMGLCDRWTVGTELSATIALLHAESTLSRGQNQPRRPETNGVRSLQLTSRSVILSSVPLHLREH